MSDPFAVEEFAKAHQYGTDQAAGDRSAHVRFYMDEMLDEKKTAEAGRPIYRSIEMCEIWFPGEKDNIPNQAVKYMSPDPRQRFPAQYAKFKAGESVQVIGSLLREWGVLDRATAKSYEAIGIYTVEQLSDVADANAAGVRGLLADRQKARDWLAKAKGLEPLAQARADMAKMQQELEALREMIRSGNAPDPAQESAPEAESAPAPKRRGRPPKAAAAQP